MNELTTGIRVIKLYAWEIPFSKLIEVCRRLYFVTLKRIIDEKIILIICLFSYRNEMKFIRHSAYFNSLIQSWVQISFRFQTFASLCLYVVLGNVLTPEKV